MLKGKRDAEKKYGKKSLMENVKDDWHWGFLSGKVSAIRWVLGLDWDVLDSRSGKRNGRRKNSTLSSTTEMRTLGKPPCP
jgi:hypothetical protein